MFLQFPTRHAYPICRTLLCEYLSGDHHYPLLQSESEEMGPWLSQTLVTLPNARTTLVTMFPTRAGPGFNTGL